jgi:hypothetical protein
LYRNFRPNLVRDSKGAVVVTAAVIILKRILLQNGKAVDLPIIFYFSSHKWVFVDGIRGKLTTNESISSFILLLLLLSFFC